MSAPPSDPERRATVLVVDADPLRRDVVVSRLAREGFAVEVAASGDEAIAKADRLAPDAVLASWRVPGGEGVELCRRVKDGLGLRTTFVALFAEADGSDRAVRALTAGADDFVPTPVDLDELTARLRAGLRRRAVDRELAAARHRSAIAQLAATLGHRINNPLTGVLGHLEMIAICLDKGDVGRVRHHVAEARRGIERIGQVSNRLTALADPKMTAYLERELMVDLGESDTPPAA